MAAPGPAMPGPQRRPPYPRNRLFVFFPPQASPPDLCPERRWGGWRGGLFPWLEDPRAVRRGGEGQAKPWGCGQGTSHPVLSHPCDAGGILVPTKQTGKKISPAPNGREVEVEFKNQPGQLQRVTKVRTGKLKGFFKKSVWKFAGP